MNSRREKEIKKEAKAILNKFAKALEQVKESPEFFVERKEDKRKEQQGSKPSSEFQKIFFENAPSTKKQCIQAEKGKWKQYGTLIEEDLKKWQEN